jgi:hypothetical protein
MTSGGPRDVIAATAQLAEAWRSSCRPGVRVGLSATLDLPTEIAELL